MSQPPNPTIEILLTLSQINTVLQHLHAGVNNPPARLGGLLAVGVAGGADRLVEGVLGFRGDGALGDADQRFVASFIGETNFLPATREGGMLRLSGGQVLEAPGDGAARQGAVTVTVRPEQVRLVDRAEAGAIPATIRTLVYFGTDTHCHMGMADGSEVVARLQSTASGEMSLQEGQEVAFRFAPGAVQVLED